MQRDRTTASPRLQPATAKQRAYLKHLRAELGVDDPLPRLNRAQASDLIAACKSIVAARDTGEDVESYNGLTREGGWTVTRLPDAERPSGRKRRPAKARKRKPKPVKTTPEADAEWTAAVERHKRAQAREEHQWMDNLM